MGGTNAPFAPLKYALGYNFVKDVFIARKKITLKYSATIC
jgi:hypothetical protein